MKTMLLSFILIIFPIETASINLLLVNDEGKTIKKIEREQFSLINHNFIDHIKLKKLADSVNKKVYEPPIEAALDHNNTITKEVPGYELDRDRFNLILHEFFYQAKSDRIDIPLKKVHPRVDSELLSEIQVNKIGKYVTHFRESNQERSHNIQLSTEAINNQVVFPGENFSFNEVVGERTKSKGYKRAPVIVEGEFSEDIGGGICQVSSTLFNAVNLNGIKIVERSSHSRSVPYVPPGKDATVSWWGPDFVFKNEYSHPLLIRAESKEGEMMIQIYSAENVQSKK